MKKRAYILIFLFIVVVTEFVWDFQPDTIITVHDWYFDAQVGVSLFIIVMAVVISRWLHIPYKLGRKGLLRGLAMGWPILLLIAQEAATGASMYRNNDYRVMFWLCVLMAIRTGIVEEIYFRGTVQGFLRRIFTGKRYSSAPIILVTASIFGLSHATGLLFGNSDAQSTVRTALFAFASGILLGTIYELTGNLLPGIVLHALIDVYGINAEVYTRSDLNFLNPYINWGAYGELYWWIAGMVVLMVIYLSLRYWRRQRLITVN